MLRVPTATQSCGYTPRPTCWTFASWNLNSRLIHFHELVDGRKGVYSLHSLWLRAQSDISYTIAIDLIICSIPYNFIWHIISWSNLLRHQCVQAPFSKYSSKSLIYYMWLMEKFVHHLWCPKQFWNRYKNNVWGIIRGAGFFPSTIWLELWFTLFVKDVRKQRLGLDYIWRRILTINGSVSVLQLFTLMFTCF